MNKKLFIDLEKCKGCQYCRASCSYPYHPKNIGITSLLERVNFLLVCRRCDDEPCVNSCPKDALEKQQDGVLKRYMMRCINCKSCSIACPFGTIFPELIPLIACSCDYCLGRAGEELPLCVPTCPIGAVEYKEIEQDPSKDLYQVADNLVVHSVHWQKKELVK